MLEGEKNLINAAKHGDSIAFGALYSHYLPQIYRFIYLKLSDKSEAEDLTHEVFLSAWRTLPSYKHRGFPLSSWLYQIARNRIIDHFRTKKINYSIEEVGEDHFSLDTVSTDDLLDANLNLEKIKEAMKALPEEAQTVLILRYVEDMPPKEIAEVLEKSEGAVRLMQHRALLRLKKLLQ
jgi:RNA polymerase sigma-70 factor (ECF subfamily)